MTMDQAIDYTLSLERQCKNPHLIPKRELQSLKCDCEAELKRIRKSAGAVPAAGGR
ncbi:hypothetical protein [Paenibacillus sp. 276b]|uniref:hypothetical protein n=1 Tax=Paenibacillus sp. 276b TaxID=1566277 RepID=UPI001C40B90D|nr:hypothetical protein [Paenibacillus sp. 276b]